MSSILFCCIKLARRNLPVTKEELDALFSEIGVIVDLSIFRNDDKLKCFIQFRHPSSVVSAMSALNNVKHSIGKIKLYVSHKTRILSTNELDFIKETQIQENETLIDRPAIITENLNLASTHLEFKSTQMKRSPVSPQQNGYQSAESWSVPQPPSYCDYLMNHSSSPHPNSHSTIPSDATIASSSEHQKYFVRSEVRPNVNSNNNFSARHFSTRAILLTDFLVYLVNAKTLSNLFGCFGNVVEVHQNRQLGKAIIAFEDIDGAIKAMQNLNGFRFFHTRLSLHYVKEDYADSSQDFNPLVQHELTTFSGRPRYHRFKDHLKIRINTISKMLHLTGIDLDLTTDVLYIIIAKIAEPTRIFLLSERSHGSRMYLVEFQDESDAAQVLAVLHNKQIGTKLLKCSFSHTKVEKYLILDK